MTAFVSQPIWWCVLNWDSFVSLFFVRFTSYVFLPGLQLLFRDLEKSEKRFNFCGLRLALWWWIYLSIEVLLICRLSMWHWMCVSKVAFMMLCYKNCSSTECSGNFLWNNSWFSMMSFNFYFLRILDQLWIPWCSSVY